MTAPERQTITDALRSDHRAIRELLADATGAREDAEGGAVREQFVMAVMRHFVAEEQYLYPTLEDGLDDGGRLGRESFDRDRSFEHRLRALEDADLTADTLAGLWTEFGAAFDAHVAAQDPMLNDLDGQLGDERLAELGDDVLGAELLAPTRPRVVAFENPAANRVTSFVEGYLDHVRDHYSRRGVDPEDEQEN